MYGIVKNSENKRTYNDIIKSNKLIKAVQKDNIKKAKNLIEKGADVNKGNVQPICYVKSMDMVELLVNNGADIHCMGVMPIVKGVYNSLSMLCQNFINDDSFDKRDFVEIYTFFLTNGVEYPKFKDGTTIMKRLREKSNGKLNEQELDKLDEITQDILQKRQIDKNEDKEQAKDNTTSKENEKY